MQTLKTTLCTILIGWPERRAVPALVRQYWNYREKLTLHNSILFKNQRAIIPKVLRPELTTRAHTSYQGIEVCIRRAKRCVCYQYLSLKNFPHIKMYLVNGRVIYDLYMYLPDTHHTRIGGQASATFQDWIYTKTIRSLTLNFYRT